MIKMKKIFFLGFMSLLILLAPKAKAAEEAPVAISFRKMIIELSGKRLEVEVAETPVQQQRGLMYRTSLDEGRGMLFIFPNEELRSFWMKNTFVPLSIGYFDKNRRLFQTVDMAPSSKSQKSFPSYPSIKPAQFALEVPRGWFSKNKITEGAVFKFISK